MPWITDKIFSSTWTIFVELPHNSGHLLITYKFWLNDFFMFANVVLIKAFCANVSPFFQCVSSIVVWSREIYWYTKLLSSLMESIFVCRSPRWFEADFFFNAFKYLLTLWFETDFCFNASKYLLLTLLTLSRQLLLTLTS